MGRKARFTDQNFIDAAIQLMADEGVTSVTMAAVAKQAQAPIGSLYHRFDSRAELLGRAWLDLVEDFQTGIIAALEANDGRRASLHTMRWCRDNFDRARALFLHRRQQVVGEAWPSRETHLQAELLTKTLGNAIRAWVEQYDPDTSAVTINKAVFALMDMPHGATYRYVAAGKQPPAHVDLFIKQSYEACFPN